MPDPRVTKFARILVDYSANIQPGERVAVTTSTAAEPLAQALYAHILERGAYPHILLDIANQEELFYAHAGEQMFEFVPLFHKMAFEEFDVLLKVRADTNTRALSQLDPSLQARRTKAMSELLRAQMRRGASGELRWMSTQYPTQAYAMEAEMGFAAYENFFYRACHADEGTEDPVASWQAVERQQSRIIDQLQGHDRVELRGPDVDLVLSIKDRKFNNSCGHHNLPDGEIYTGPVEESVAGWVRYTYPAVIHGRVVEGVELSFEHGRVVKATAARNQDYLLKMIDTDPGARYVGEFAIGTNYQIDRFTRNILFDEKIGGSFHTALGAGYPETGSRNQSVIHWDMICDLHKDSEILLDGETVYKDGRFLIGS